MRKIKLVKILVILIAAPVWSQDRLSLRDAVRLSLRENKAVAAAAAGLRASAAKLGQARASALPKLDYSESFVRSDNPVFVFSSLLTQHRFGVENFHIGPLNRPAALNNFESQLTLSQNLYDAGESRTAVRSADLGRQMSAEEQRRVEMGVIAAVARAYYDAVLAAQSLRAAEMAVRSAEADLKRAESVRAAGMSTDADVLSIRVHLAGVHERRIQRAAELDIAQAALNDALGLPLDTPHLLPAALVPLDLPDLTLETLERGASAGRPEARQTRSATDLAKVQADAARGTLRPQVSFQAAFTADRQRFFDQGGGNWLASIHLQWNLFNGFADRARIEESVHRRRQAQLDQERVTSAVRLEVRRAWAELRSAGQRIEVAQAAVAEAEESLRIVQNRYQAGMSTLTGLLRNETALLESRTRYLAAVHDQRVAATLLELAAGRLSVDSEVLN